MYTSYFMIVVTPNKQADTATASYNALKMNNHKKVIIFNCASSLEPSNNALHTPRSTIHKYLHEVTTVVIDETRVNGGKAK
jgi:hypothetical protein